MKYDPNISFSTLPPEPVFKGMAVKQVIIFFNEIMNKRSFWSEKILQWKAHTDAIKYIRVITETKEPVIFTASVDRMAKLWARYF